jgi:hypothetical protein
LFALVYYVDQIPLVLGFSLVCFQFRGPKNGFFPVGFVMALFIKKLKGKKTFCLFAPSCTRIWGRPEGKWKTSRDRRQVQLENRNTDQHINVVNELTDNERAERATAHLALVRYKG